MAWVELTQHDDTKIIVNTDLIVSIENYWQGGGQLFIAVAKKTDLTALHDLRIKEDKEQIEALLVKAAMPVIR